MTNLYELIKKNPFIDCGAIYKSINDFKILGVSASSHKCRPGYLFVATHGATKTSRNGHDFIEHAIENGAIAVIVHHDFVPDKNFPVPLIVARDSKAALCYLSEAFYNNPSTALKVIGITGTSGKTSTSFMLHSILKKAGYKSKIMGTLGMGDPHDLIPLSHTTMDPEFISENLAKMLKEGVTHVIMEVSSHALSLKRVEAIDFAAIGLTNITQDHLDFHGTLLEYQNAKARLFMELAQEQTCIALPHDHPFKGLTHKNLIFFGGDQTSEIASKNVHVLKDNTAFTLRIKEENRLVTLPFLGDFQVQNACLSAALAKSLGLNFDHIVQGLKMCPIIPGRLEHVANHTRRVFIDFSHKPEALSSCLRTVRKITPNKILLVFGCGGERDKTKRSLMGNIAETLSDIVIVTDDNPRREDPSIIRKEIICGMKDPNRAHEIADRKEAIMYAIKHAQKNDTVVIAGKGHENYQVYGTTSYAFSDYVEAKKVLDAL